MAKARKFSSRCFVKIGSYEKRRFFLVLAATKYSAANLSYKKPKLIIRVAKNDTLQGPTTTK